MKMIFKMMTLAIALSVTSLAHAQLTDSSGNSVVDSSGAPVQTGYSHGIPQSQTVGQVAEGGLAYQNTSDGNKPCKCNETPAPLQAKNQWTSLAPVGGTQVLPDDKAGGADNPGH